MVHRTWATKRRGGLIINNQQTKNKSFSWNLSKLTKTVLSAGYNSKKKYNPAHYLISHIIEGMYTIFSLIHRWEILKKIVKKIFVKPLNNTY